MRKMLFITAIFFVIQSFVESAELEKIAEIESLESWFWRLSLTVDDQSAYLCACISVDDEYYHKGMIAQIDCASKEVVWQKKIEDAEKTIVPQIIKVTDNDEIELLSELSLLRSPFTYGNQVINVRKYTMDGKEISNYSDSSEYLKAIKADFPIRYNDKTDGISVYYTPMSHHTKSYSYAVHFDESGKYLSSSLIDSSIVISPDTLDRFIAKGFENYSSGVYVYGRKHSKKEPSEVLSGYILKLDTADKLIWKKSIELGNAYFTIEDIFVTANDEIVVLGFKGDGNGCAYKINSSGEIIWEVDLGTQEYSANPGKIIQNLSGDFIIVGKAVKKIEQPISEKYIAKINNDGMILWQKHEASQYHEFLTDVIEYEPNKYYTSSMSSKLALLYKFEDPDISAKEHKPIPEIRISEFPNHYEIDNFELYETVDIVSIRGKVLKSFSIAGKSSFQIEKDINYRGVFFIRLTGKQGILVKKLLF